MSRRQWALALLVAVVARAQEAPMPAKVKAAVLVYSSGHEPEVERKLHASRAPTSDSTHAGRASRRIPLRTRKGGIKFQMNGKPWREVLEWLADQSGEAWISPPMPVLGTFTYVGPADARYSVAEIFAIVNRALLREGYQLVRRQRSFIVQPTDNLAGFGTKE
jgi:hypothetical protein